MEPFYIPLLKPQKDFSSLPKLFKLIINPFFRGKEVDDDGTVVHYHPTRERKTFDIGVGHSVVFAFFLGVFDQAVQHAVACAGGQNKKICKIRNAA